MATTTAADDKDFFLPDLCQGQSILFLVIVTELLVFAHVLAGSTLLGFSWAKLGLSSLFTQWVVLFSAAVLCNIRPFLSSVSTLQATTTGYAVIMVLVAAFSVIGELLLGGATDRLAIDWDLVVRNVLIGAIMTGIAFRYFYLQHQLRSKEQAELHSRIQALQSRIRPHFLFNSMNIIASLISIDPDTAEEVVEDLSVLFRASLNDASDHPVALSEELELCRKYLHIESLRLDDRLSVECDVDVDTSEVRIPMLTLQPLLENAVYHGIQPLPEGGTVSVRIFEADDMLEVVIRNPVGETKHAHEQGNRMAMENIRSRLLAIYGASAVLETDAGDGYFQMCVVYPLLPDEGTGASDMPERRNDMQ